ncbi:hypothetical protein Scep_002943 [Stephania cephalantha]|uniref:Uncharacterized protein n=1 Tax=Stephania cephalantha TaxID=152367 RepID=A0AAP0Q4T0_9MAGN
MDFVNSLLNLVVPPASLVMLAFAWPTLCFIRAVEWAFRSFYTENMEDKVVIITGASSGIGEMSFGPLVMLRLITLGPAGIQIAYEYAKRGATLALVAKRVQRLRGISEGARRLGAQHVMIMAADVVKEDDCRRFIGEVISYYGRVDHLVNTASLGHSFFFEEAIDTSVFPHLMAAKAAIINFYETLRFEVKDESPVSSGQVEEFARSIVAGACRGDTYVKVPNWYDVFMVYRVFSPDVLRWTFRLLLAPQAARVANHAVGTSGRPMLDSPPRASGSRPMLETSSPRSLTGSPAFNHQQKVD